MSEARWVRLGRLAAGQIPVSPDIPLPVVSEFRLYAAWRLGAAAESASHALIIQARRELEELARTLMPTVESAAQAAGNGGVLDIAGHGFWAAGWLHYLTGRPVFPYDDTAAGYSEIVGRTALAAVRAVTRDTRHMTRALTAATRDAIRAALPDSRNYGEIRVPVLARDTDIRYGRMDVLGWCPGCPDIVIEIDSADQPGTARKLEFARDAGALPILIRHGTGRMTVPDGIAVIDLRAAGRG